MMVTLFDPEVDAAELSATGPTPAQVQRESDEKILLSVVRRFPKHTRDELWQRLSIEQPWRFLMPLSVQGLLMSLLRIGKVDTGKERACRVSGKVCPTWEAR